MRSETLINTGSGNGFFLMVPSNYQNESWLTIDEIQWHSIQGNAKWNAQDANPQDEFQIYIFEITAASLRGS